MTRLWERFADWSISGGAWRGVVFVSVVTLLGLAVVAALVGVVALPIWYFDPDRGKPCLEEKCERQIVYIPPKGGAPIYGNVCRCVAYGERPQ